MTGTHRRFEPVHLPSPLPAGQRSSIQRLEAFVKKSIPLIAVVVAGGLVLSACGSSNDNAGSSTPAGGETSAAGGESSAAATESSAGGGSSAAGESSAPGGGAQLPATTISILAPSYADSSQADWQKIIDAFKKIQPNVTVKLQIEPWTDFTSKVQARIQAQDMPDILNDNNFGEAADGLLYPINEVLSDDTLKSIEPALMKNGVGTDGTQWAAPDIATSRLLVYNTELFSKAGISAAPKTWDEMYSDADKIAKLGGGVSGYGMPLGPEEAQAESTVWLWGAGGTWVDGDKLNADTPAATEAFTEMKKFIDGKVTQPNVGASNRQDVADLFNQGKIGMYVAHSGLTGETRTKFKNIKFDVAPIPSKSGEGISYGVTDYILAFNNKDEARKAATKAFLDFFYQPAQYTAWYKGTGLLPATTAAIEAATKDDADNAPFYEALKTVKFTPSGNPQWAALQTALQSTAGKVATEAPADVLKEIQAQMTAGG
jgi:multiple sugar transport system substrate-binding protein